MEVRRELAVDEITYLHPFTAASDEEEEINDKKQEESFILPENSSIPLDPNEMLIEIVSVRALVDFIDKKTEEKIFLDISIAGKRFKTKKVSAETDPRIEGVFSIILNKPIIELIHEGPSSLILICEKEDEQYVYGYGTFDWRPSLSGYMRTQIVLRGNNEENNGLVDIKITLANKLATAKQLKQYLMQLKTSSTFICKLRSRYLPTPMHAFRFVNLLSKMKNKSEQLVNLKTGEFVPAFSIHSILASKNTNVHELTVLLVCLLSGFGMDAYLYKDKAITVDNNGIVEWSINDKKRNVISRIDAVPLVGFRKIVKPIVERPSSDIFDEMEWKTTITSPPYVTPSISPCRAIKETELEESIKMMLSQYITKGFDSELEKYLRPIVGTLETKELEFPDENWSASIAALIQNLLPEKTSLKMATIFTTKPSAEVICNKIINKCNALIGSNPVSVGLSLSVHPYAEDVYAIWTIVGFVVKN